MSGALLLIQTLPGEDERHLLESAFNLVEASDVAARWSSAASATCTAVVQLEQKVHFFLNAQLKKKKKSPSSDKALNKE